MSEVTSPERHKVCQQLDKVLLEFFSTLADLYKEQKLLEQNMKSGYINMSRARYSMGIKNVGIQQCDESNMCATARVNIEDDNFVLVDPNNTNKLDQSEDQTLRRRNPHNKTEDGFEFIEKVEDLNISDKDNDDDSDNKSITQKVCDPLKWFGVLVPPALRQSQKDFKGAVDISLSIANLKMKLGKLQDDYISLMEQKKELSS